MLSHTQKKKQPEHFKVTMADFSCHILKTGGKCGTPRHSLYVMYVRDRLKASTRNNRGHDQRRKVASSPPIPSNWKSSLCKKTNLEKEISKTKISLISNWQERVLCSSKEADLKNLVHCSH